MRDDATRDPTPYELGDRLRNPRHLFIGAESNPRIALVTEASTGLGFEVARALAKQGMHVIIADDSLEDMANAVEALQMEDLDISCIPVRAGKPGFLAMCVANFIDSRCGRLDVLVNHHDFAAMANSQTTVDRLTLDLTLKNREILEMTRRLVPSLAKSSSARIVNAFVRAEHVTDFMVREHAGQPILINAVYAGQAETFSGSGEFFPSSQEELVQMIVSAALLPDNGPHGQTFGNSYFW